jgi:hypothetical protein
MRTFLLALVLLGACKRDAEDSADTDTVDDTAVTDTEVDDSDPVDTSDTTDTSDDTSPVNDGPDGFIGSACERDSDCAYDGGVCFMPDEGFPRGTCTQACDRICPDRSGHPTTFCVTDSQLPAAAPTLDDGACLSRCDFGIFPGTGCRTGYGCAEASRANEPNTRQNVCLPGVQTQVSACQQELIARGIAFEPTVIPDTSPSTHPSLTCHVEDPVKIKSPLLGVELVYFDGTPTPNVTGACEMALALADTAEDVRPRGVRRIRHIGTYNCRVIAGTSSLSRHAYGDAIDIYGFDFNDGTEYTLIDDWEHNTTSPVSAGARFLYDAGYRWYNARIWNIILTPNYNAAHDNHFHIDMTPGSHYIRSVQGGEPHVFDMAPLRPAPEPVYDAEGRLVPTCVH